MTLNKLSAIQKHVSKTVRRLNRRIQLVLDESDEISNPSSNRCKAVLACFRRCWGKLLTTGTSTRNNISEFAPQMELLYNNSINMISWNSFVYVHSKENTDSDAPSREANPYYGKPFPAYKKDIPCSPNPTCRKRSRYLGLDSGRRIFTIPTFSMTFLPKPLLPEPLRKSLARISSGSIRCLLSLCRKNGQFTSTPLIISMK